jgi:hypothetical protein
MLPNLSALALHATPTDGFVNHPRRPGDQEDPDEDPLLNDLPEERGTRPPDDEAAFDLIENPQAVFDHGAEPIYGRYAGRASLWRTLMNSYGTSRQGQIPQSNQIIAWEDWVELANRFARREDGFDKVQAMEKAIRRHWFSDEPAEDSDETEGEEEDEEMEDVSDYDDDDSLPTPEDLFDEMVSSGSAVAAAGTWQQLAEWFRWVLDAGTTGEGTPDRFAEVATRIREDAAGRGQSSLLDVLSNLDLVNLVRRQAGAIADARQAITRRAAEAEESAAAPAAAAQRAPRGNVSMMGRFLPAAAGPSAAAEADESDEETPLSVRAARSRAAAAAHNDAVFERALSNGTVAATAAGTWQVLMRWYREISSALRSGNFNATVRRIVNVRMQGEVPASWTDGSGGLDYGEILDDIEALAMQLRPSRTENNAAGPPSSAAVSPSDSIEEREYDVAWLVLLQHLDGPSERALLYAARSWQTLLAWWRDLVGGVGAIEALVSGMPPPVREMWTDGAGNILRATVMTDVHRLVRELQRNARAVASETAAAGPSSSSRAGDEGPQPPLPPAARRRLE